MRVLTAGDVTSIIGQPCFTDDRLLRIDMAATTDLRLGIIAPIQLIAVTALDLEREAIIPSLDRQTAEGEGIAQDRE